MRKHIGHFLWVVSLSVVLVLGMSGGVWAQSVHQQLGTYVVNAGQTLHGNVTLNAGTVDVYGRVDGNVTVDVGTVDVTGVVTGNVNVGTGSIITGPKGRIEGQRTVGVGTTNGQRVASLGIPYTLLNQIPFVGSLGFHTTAVWGGWGGSLLKLVINLVVTGLLVTIMPGFLNKVTEEMDHDGIAAAGVGCLGLIGLVVALLGLTIIIIGIPVAFLLGVGGVVAWVLANAALVWWLGYRVSQTAWTTQPRYPYREILIGAVVLTVVEIIPWIGGLIGLILELLAFGALLRMLFFSNRHRWPFHRLN